MMAVPAPNVALKEDTASETCTLIREKLFCTAQTKNQKNIQQPVSCCIAVILKYLCMLLNLSNDCH